MKTKAIIPILTGILLAGCQSASPPALSVFKSDGCSCFPEGTPKEPSLWERHCIAHDHSYWKGGTREERRLADMKLREGIRGEGKPVIAGLAYAAVRAGGVPWLPTPWRWGFGWREFPRGYRELGVEELRLIRQLEDPMIQSGLIPRSDGSASR